MTYRADAPGCNDCRLQADAEFAGAELLDRYEARHPLTSASPSLLRMCAPHFLLYTPALSQGLVALVITAPTGHVLMRRAPGHGPAEALADGWSASLMMDVEESGGDDGADARHRSLLLPAPRMQV